MKLTGLKKAVSTFNNWQGHSEIVLDIRTGELTAYEYVSKEYVRYEPYMKIVASKGQFSIWERDDKINMHDLKFQCSLEYPIYMNPKSGSIGNYDEWWLLGGGNAVDNGDVIEVTWNKKTEQWEEV